jgi:hypothetical protein
MTYDQMVEVRDKVLPGGGNLPSGEPTKDGANWTVPFKRKGSEWHAFFLDRAINSEADKRRAVLDLESAIGQALASSDEGPFH